MTRTLLTIVLPFLAPTLIYFFWTRLARARALAQGRSSEDAKIDVPWFWLGITGGALAIVGLIAGFLFTEAGAPGSTYVPAHVEDGELVPGTFEPAPAED